MTPTKTPSRVVAIGDPNPTQQQITTALNSQEEFQLVDILSSSERLAREIGAAKAELILIDHQLGGQPTLDIIDDIALEFPEAAIIAILPENDSVLIHKVMLAGARAFLVQPFTQINLLSTLRRVRELEGRRRIQPSLRSAGPEITRSLKTVTVFSPRGGVGSSMVAVNLAVALQEETNLRVLLFDGKLFFGHLAVLLNIRAQNTIADLIPHASSMDEALIHEVVVEHGTGVHVLLSPANVQTAQGIRPDDVYTVLMGLHHYFDLIVIDAGSTLNENSVTMMDAADRILLVTSPDLASLHDISRFIQMSQSLSYTPEKMLVVLNREGIQGGVSTKDIESALHSKVFAKIPEDSPNALRSLNRGLPLLVRYPRSPASRAIRQLAKVLTEVKIAEQSKVAIGQAANKAQRDALLVSSQFG
jgi:pilus assembly protein CpaE